MSEKRRKPTERQKNCSYSFPYMGENFDKVYCSKKVEDDIVAVSGEECESCIQFKNKHIQYPIEHPTEEYEIDLVEDDIDFWALKEEKRRLLKRIEDIDLILQKEEQE